MQMQKTWIDECLQWMNIRRKYDIHSNMEAFMGKYCKVTVTEYIKDL